MDALPWIFVAGLAVLFLLINLRVPLFADDYCRFSPTFDLHSAIRDTWAEYFSWSGRFPTNFLNHIAFSSGRTGIQILAVISTASFAALAAVALFAADRSASPLQRLSVVACFFYLLWLTPHSFGEVVFWKTGAIQYFFATVCAAACFVPAVRFMVRGESVGFHPALYAPYLVLCFLGGAWLENQSVAVAAVWFSLLLMTRMQKRRLPVWVSAGGVIWLLGTVAVVAAPGNLARAAIVGEGPPLQERLDFILEWIPRLLDGRLFLLFALFVTLSAVNRSEALRARLVQALALAITGLLSALALIAVPAHVIHGRPSFPLEVFFVFSVISVFPSEVFGQASRASTLSRSVINVTSLLLAVSLVQDMLDTRSTYRNVWKQDLAREVLVREALASGEKVISLPALSYGPKLSTYHNEFSSGRLFSRDFSPDKTYWTNTCYARAHGLRSVAQSR